MSRRKLRDFLAVVFVGLFLMSHEMVFIWLLVGSIVLLHPENNKGESKGQRGIKSAQKDAKKYDLKIPNDVSIRHMIAQVYDRYQQSLKLYPHLEAQYEGIVEDFWKSLVVQSDKDHWRYLLTTILAEWPAEIHRPQNNLRKKLDEVKKLTHQWDDAKKEAFGEV